VWLHDADPVSTHADRRTWDAALERASTIVAHAGYLTDGIREHATVVFPAESHAEHEGTVTHPDGRVQRLRQAIARQGETRAGWWILSELAKRLGMEDVRVLTGAMASQQLFAAVPFYAGLSLDAIGPQGVRWADGGAAAFPAPAELPPGGAPVAAAVGPPPDGPAQPGQSVVGALRLGTFRSIWAAPEVERSPALKFLHPRQRVEMAPGDASRLGLAHGDKVTVSADGAGVQAVVALRAASPAGSVFLEDGIPVDAANVLDGPLVDIRKA
jgi:NADH-quinone oxidoreductase subunit G